MERQTYKVHFNMGIFLSYNKSEQHFLSGQLKNENAAVLMNWSVTGLAST